VALEYHSQSKAAEPGDDESLKLYCVYVAIGQKRSTVAQFVKVWKSRARWPISIVVAATAVRSGADAVLAPFAGCAMANIPRHGCTL